MDIITVVGLLGSLLTVEQSSRGHFSLLRKRAEKKRIQTIKWDSSDPALQRFIDSFKSSFASYREYIFSEEEIKEIAGEFIARNAHLNLTSTDRATNKLERM